MDETSTQGWVEDETLRGMAAAMDEPTLPVDAFMTRCVGREER